MSDKTTSEAIDLSKLRQDPPPYDGRQFIAWGFDLYARRHADSEVPPRWMVVQWAPDYPGGEPYWRWAVPGMSTSVKILGWLPLPWNDVYGNYALGIEPEEAA